MHCKVSILVFVELALGHGLIVLPLPDPLFQSLFLWNLPSDEIEGINDADRAKRFNPCFCGTCPRTLLEGWFSSLTLGFQSLFLWNLPSDFLPNLSCPIFSMKFQSLFLWNLPSDPGRQVPKLSRIISFNPCFCGTCPRTGFGFKFNKDKKQVSILVFVELALGPDPLHPSSSLLFRF